MDLVVFVADQGKSYLLPPDRKRGLEAREKRPWLRGDEAVRGLPIRSEGWAGHAITGKTSHDARLCSKLAEDVT